MSLSCTHVVSFLMSSRKSLQSNVDLNVRYVEPLGSLKEGSLLVLFALPFSDRMNVVHLYVGRTPTLSGSTLPFTSPSFSLGFWPLSLRPHPHKIPYLTFPTQTLCPLLYILYLDLRRTSPYLNDSWEFKLLKFLVLLIYYVSHSPHSFTTTKTKN